MEKIPVRHHIATRKEINATENFVIREVADFIGGEDMVQQLHRHDFYYLIALKKGTGDHEIDFHAYTIDDHSIFFMRPGQVHQLTLKADSTGYLIQFRHAYYFSHHKAANQLLRKACSINHYQLNVDSFRKVLAIFTYIFQEYTDRQERYQEVIKANMEVLFIELIRQQHSPSSDSDNSYPQERLEELLELLETHVITHKQVSQYAAMMNLSTYQLNAVTKTTLEKNCSALINEYIILEAKRYLLATSNQVNQVADQLGYEDVSYFIRFFKKQTGYSPESFRHDFK
jgi:AraC family transcriptional activator of pobA